MQSLTAVGGGKAAVRIHSLSSDSDPARKFANAQ